MLTLGLLPLLPLAASAAASRPLPAAAVTQPCFTQRRPRRLALAAAQQQAAAAATGLVRCLPSPLAACLPGCLRLQSSKLEWSCFASCAQPVRPRPRLRRRSRRPRCAPT